MLALQIISDLVSSANKLLAICSGRFWERSKHLKPSPIQHPALTMPCQRLRLPFLVHCIVKLGLTSFEGILPWLPTLFRPLVQNIAMQQTLLVHCLHTGTVIKPGLQLWTLKWAYEVIGAADRSILGPPCASLAAGALRFFRFDWCLVLEDMISGEHVWDANQGFLVVCQGALAKEPPKLTFDELNSRTYLEIKGTGIANQCPIIAGGEDGFKVKAGKYTLKKLCMEPTSFTVKAESQFKDKPVDFQKTKLMTRLTYTLDEIEGPLDVSRPILQAAPISSLLALSAAPL